MYALIKNGKVQKYPYSFFQLRLDNPSVSYPESPSDEWLASVGVHAVAREPQPAYNALTHDVQELSPEYSNGTWVQNWSVVALTPEMAAQRAAEHLEAMKAARADAYRQEADPLFFKAQRNEGTIAEWEQKVQEIRARYPYPGE